MVADLWTSRVVLETLGVDDYGVYNLVSGMVMMMAFLKYSLANATQRFLSYELGLGGKGRFGHVFSMALTVHLLAGLVVVALGESVGLWLLNTQLNIPAPRMEAANWIYQSSLAIACVQLAQSPYHASLMSHEKMAPFAYLGIVESVLRLAFLYVLLSIGSPSVDKLQVYGLGLFAIAGFIFLFYKRYSNRHIPDTRYRPVWDKPLLRQLAAFSAWTQATEFSSIVSMQGVNMVLNKVHGVAFNATIGIATQLFNGVTQFASSFQVVFRPQIVKSYAQGNAGYLASLLVRATKFPFLLLLLVVVPLGLNLDFLLGLWLKTVPPDTASIGQIFLLYTLFQVALSPLEAAIQATGKIRAVQTLNCLAFLLFFAVAAICLLQGMAPHIVPVCYCALSVLRAGVDLSFLRRLVGIGVPFYFRQAVLRSWGVVLVSFPLPFYVASLLEGWLRLLLSTLAFLACYAPAALFLGLTKSERKKVFSKFHA
jgi:O-antigen/teichoic acid export membrane protein